MNVLRGLSLHQELPAHWDRGGAITKDDLGVSKNRGTRKSSILIGFSIINHPFWGYPYFWKHPFITAIAVS